ncbi:MFS transporter [Catellatospora sp. TT07R-123]|uniref:MFS transporter n=1 Tax=Catellatospora sp. TT07R-123 TaxID=2733863 RepID=UPI001B1FFB7C|nr:MFS transporter [Catellatospora sp. TT07R-123]GHJ50171.1 MFS transporter [Catellatospora sp. TT07R-123]
MSPQIAPLAGRREWIGLTVLLLPLLLVSMDVSVLYFAVPFISLDLHPSATQQLWIFDIYGFVLAGLLITMGALGDRIGRRRLLLIGAFAFAATSTAAAYAHTAGALIGARALLGIGGATLMPSTLALVRNMFQQEKQRATAIAIWTAALTSGIALGPILSGFLLERFWWGSVFLINVPFMLLLVVLAPALVPESKHVQGGRFDLPGSVLSLGAVLPVIWGVKELAANGVSARPLAAIGVGVLLGAGFVWRQRAAAYPMLDLALFRRPAFGGAIAVSVIAMFGLVGFAIFTTQFLQSVLDMTPLKAALWSLAPSLVVGGAAPGAAALAQRGVRKAHLVCGGFLIALVGFAALQLVKATSPLWLLLVCAMLYAVGLVVVMSLGTEMIVGAVPVEQAGAASAVSETGTEFGGALGMALLGSLGAAVYRHEVPVPAGLEDSAGTIRETLAGAAAVARTLPGPAAHDLLTSAKAAFSTGMHAAAFGAVAVMALGAVIALIALRRVPQVAADPAPAAAPAELDLVA